MYKIYDKCFPMEPYKLDNKLMQNSIRLSWIEPKHIIKIWRKMAFKFNYLIDNALKYMKLIDFEKSPMKKYLCIDKIIKLIKSYLKFEEYEKIDREDIKSILIYIFIKSASSRNYSNLKFIELYNNKMNDIQTIRSAFYFIEKIKYSDLINVSQEEFIRKCNESTKEDKNM